MKLADCARTPEGCDGRLADCTRARHTEGDAAIELTVRARPTEGGRGKLAGLCAHAQLRAASQARLAVLVPQLRATAATEAAVRAHPTKGRQQHLGDCARLPD